MTTARPRPSTVVAEADAAQREAIYRIRHDVYAVELGQHPVNTAGRLTDRLDDVNRFLVALRDGEVAAFVSITPPGPLGYSVEKYFERPEMPLDLDGGTYEIRLLTVLEQHRDTDLAATLMVAAYRWIEARGGRTVVAIGRDEVTPMYVRGGMRRTGLTTTSGAVTFELMHADVAEVRAAFDALESVVAAIERAVDWRLHVPLRKPAACFHGGVSFEAVGVGLDDLGRHRDVVNADVLDAWFPPAPAVLDALHDELPWLLRTSPPVDCAGLVAAVATARGLDAGCVLPGAGSSDLIFRALTRWLDRSSRVVLLDPTYGEYAHVLEKVVGCRVERLPLERSDDYRPDLAALVDLVASGPDLVVLVNPNSPTGQVLTVDEVDLLLRAAPPSTRVWVDETYVDFAGQSVEPLIRRHDHLVVCKSMSKAYALSGARVAYLAAASHQLEELRSITPPWVVGLVSQVAAVRALQSPGYYRDRWDETHGLRRQLTVDLRGLGWDVVDGCAGFVLAHLPDEGPTAAQLVAGAREHGVFLRDAAGMGRTLGDRAVRVAVKDADSQRRIVQVVDSVQRSWPLARTP
ncbi:aminotransferase class I/II-fold pyridoxal phosphate-dependent enzyme [Aeromicrobium sp. CFBP 8757]|uniref:histidinol-phosphate aminotransferase family protein n=1 Tax=Aeromicrobium sp. CFBP 8757 TaxID=2775288 RepID=UPI00177ADE17|nr:aminotransferase class I/II-fold pyridoxal phosphate-dependent enzyme [Aeromicrobium sp. CFBP 8757]